MRLQNYLVGAACNIKRWIRRALWELKQAQIGAKASLTQYPAWRPWLQTGEKAKATMKTSQKTGKIRLKTMSGRRPKKSAKNLNG